jgi:hypothetical protein
MLFVISDFIFSTDFENIRQDVNKVKKYASDLQTFLGVNKMTSVVDGEVKKQKGAINYDLFELKVNFSSELKSFVKDVSIHNTRHFVYSYERLEITTIFLYFIHILPNIFKVSSFGFHGNQYFF